MNEFRDHCVANHLWSEILEYDGQNLFWKIDILAGSGVGYVKTSAGSRADKGQDADGRPVVSLGKHCTKGAHVIIWEMFNGPVPEGYEVDHIKEIRETGGVADNSIQNLQLLEPTDNKKKSCKIPRSNNKSGRVGVHYSEEREAWVAQGTNSVGERVWLGQYRTFEEAEWARKFFEDNGFSHKSGRAVQYNNTSGCSGVNWDKTHERWVARIYVDGKRKCLGYFKNRDDAVAARKNAEKTQEETV